MAFSDRLKELRTQKKITRRDLAEILGINNSTYGKYELGQREPNTEMLQKLADYFDVSVDYLLGRTNNGLNEISPAVERISALIEEKGVTAAEVAKEVGIPKSTITEWKKGRSKPSSEAVVKLAEYFDVSTDYLLGRSDLKQMVPTIAAHSDGPNGLPPEAQQEVMQYIEFIKQKYGIGKEDEK